MRMLVSKNVRTLMQFFPRELASPARGPTAAGPGDALVQGFDLAQQRILPAHEALQCLDNDRIESTMPPPSLRLRTLCQRLGQPEPPRHVRPCCAPGSLGRHVLSPLVEPFS